MFVWAKERLVFNEILSILEKYDIKSLLKNN